MAWFLDRQFRILPIRIRFSARQSCDIVYSLGLTGVDNVPLIIGINAHVMQRNIIVYQQITLRTMCKIFLQAKCGGIVCGCVTTEIVCRHFGGIVHAQSRVFNRHDALDGRKSVIHGVIIFVTRAQNAKFCVLNFYVDATVDRLRILVRPVIVLFIQVCAILPFRHNIQDIVTGTIMNDRGVINGAIIAICACIHDFNCLAIFIRGLIINMIPAAGFVCCLLEFNFHQRRFYAEFSVMVFQCITRNGFAISRYGYIPFIGNAV